MAPPHPACQPEASRWALKNSQSRSVEGCQIVRWPSGPAAWRAPAGTGTAAKALESEARGQKGSGCSTCLSSRKQDQLSAELRGHASDELRNQIPPLSDP